MSSSIIEEDDICGLGLEAICCKSPTSRLAANRFESVVSSSGIDLRQNGLKVQHFDRLLMFNTIYCSEQYSRSGSRNNTVCCYHSSLGYGKIEVFFIAQDVSPFCLIEAFSVAHDTSPLTNLRSPRNKKMRQLNAQDVICHQIIHVAKSPGRLVALPLQHIIKKCLFNRVPIVGQHAEYIIPNPNPYEVYY